MGISPAFRSLTGADGDSRGMNLQPLARPGSPAAHTTASPSADAGLTAAKPRNLLRGLVPGFLESSMMQLAEDTFRKATAEQLQTGADFAAGIDREKALAFAGLLAWAAAGDRPEVSSPRGELLTWLYTASPEEIRRLAARIVALSTPGATILASAICEHVQIRDQAAIRRENGKA